MSGCHYGCMISGKCMGAKPKDVVEFLSEKAPGPKYDQMSMPQLEKALDEYNENYSDEFYAGPNHIQRKSMFEADSEWAYEL